MSIGDLAGLIAAIAFVLLVGVLAIPLFKFGRVLDQATQTLKDVTDHTMPIIDEAAETVVSAREQLDKVDVMTTAAAETTDRKSTRLNSSHVAISYAVFCLNKKTQR